MATYNASLICTVLDEEQTIKKFIDSIINQSVLPKEIIIIDGGSKDKTVETIKNQESRIKGKKINFKLIEKRGNRSVGRNVGIKNAFFDIILLSDSGCVLDKDWVKEIVKPFSNKKADVVAGYYRGESANVFQKCLIPYVLVMPNKINENEFLPATRSMAMKKSVWKKAGCFNEKLSHNEDFAFANKLKEINARIVFQKNAIVKWFPRKNLAQAFKMFFRFAYGDAEAGILRSKVIFQYLRYLLLFYVIFLAFVYKSLFLMGAVIFGIVFYLFWAIYKNYKYVNNLKAIVILPILQITSDLAVLMGTTLGITKRIMKINYKNVIRTNLIQIGLIGIYILTLLFVITSGIPNQSHPFPYQMDEWHQLQAVRNVFKFGTPNLDGSANGTMFHFLISGMLLTPFYLSKIVNPFLIKSAVDLLPEQEKLFIVLRLTTLLFGVLTLINVAKLSRILKTNVSLGIFIFFMTPAWLVLSNFFKYDIGLLFWITLSLLFLIKYRYSPSAKNFILSSIFSAVAFSVKVTGITMVPVVILSYFLFTPNFNKKYIILFTGLAVFTLISALLGIPDLIFGGKSLYRYLYENLVLLPNETATNIRLSESLFNITFFHKMPLIFGHVFFYLSVFSAFFLLVSSLRDYIKKNYSNFKLKIFLLFSLIVFAVSLIPLNVGISANRALVLLPFMVIVDLIVFKEIVSILRTHMFLKKIMLLFFALLLIIQIMESYIWVQLKVSDLPEKTASTWLQQYIPKDSIIGLENVPIYQFEPDVVLKEFYLKQYNPNYDTQYEYYLIDSKTKNLPEYIIISNVHYEQQYYIKSDKSILVARLKRAGYKEINYFFLNPIGYRFFDRDFNYPSIGLYAYPQGISIYKK